MANPCVRRNTMEAARHRRDGEPASGRVAFRVLCTLVTGTCLRGLVLVAAPNASVTGPISSPGSAFITPPGNLDLAASGYVEEEFFIEGIASAYSAAGAFLADGRWAATPASSAP